jgi:hypothetical protein
MFSKTGGTKKKNMYLKIIFFYFLSLKYPYKKILIKKLSNRDR